MSRGTMRSRARLFAVMAISTAGVVVPAGAEASPMLVSYVLPDGSNQSLLSVSVPESEVDALAPGATIRLDAPNGIDFSNASVTDGDILSGSEPRALPVTVTDNGKSIQWSVPGDIPTGSIVDFSVRGVAAPGYNLHYFSSGTYFAVDVETGGATQEVIDAGLDASFTQAAPATFAAGQPTTWTLPSPSVTLDQLATGTGAEPRFGPVSGAFIPDDNGGGESYPVSVSADGRSVTATLPYRSDPFALVLYTEAEDPTQSDLHSLAFIFDDTTVARTCAVSERVIGAIRDRYVSLGGPCGFLGDPLTAELATPVKFGRFNHFEGGSIYWSPSTGAWEVHGAIRETWSRLGWENGAVGFPLTDELPTPHKFGAFNHFQSGSIYWSPATGAREVRGAIRDTWSRQGWENGALGFPTSDEYAIPGGRRSDFQGGFITWTPAGGTVVKIR